MYIYIYTGKHENKNDTRNAHFTQASEQSKMTWSVSDFPNQQVRRMRLLESISFLMDELHGDPFLDASNTTRNLEIIEKPPHISNLGGPLL